MYINKNTYSVNGDVTSLTIKSRGVHHVATFDTDMLGVISGYQWRISEKRGKMYVCTGQCKNGGRIIYLPWIVMHHTPTKGVEVDHIDGEALNNTRANLRVISRDNNIRNVCVRTDNRTTRIRGVSYATRDDVFRVDMADGGRRMYFKPFRDLPSAVYTRYILEGMLLGEFRSSANDESINRVTGLLSDSSKRQIENYCLAKCVSSLDISGLKR